MLATKPVHIERGAAEHAEAEVEVGEDPEIVLDEVSAMDPGILGTLPVDEDWPWALKSHCEDPETQRLASLPAMSGQSL